MAGSENPGDGGDAARVDYVRDSMVESLFALFIARAAMGADPEPAQHASDAAPDGTVDGLTSASGGSPADHHDDHPADVTGPHGTDSVDDAARAPAEITAPHWSAPGQAGDDGATDSPTGADLDVIGQADGDEEVSRVRAALVAAAGRYGVELADILAPLDAQGQDPADLLEMAAAFTRVISWAHARRGEAVAALAEAAAEHNRHLPGRTVDPHTVAATELAMRLTMSKQAATRMVRTSSLLNGPLTATGLSLEHGALDPTKAQIIADALDHVPHQIAWDVENAVLPGAQGRTHAQLRNDLARALIAADHHEAERRHRHARTTRRVCHPKALPDGMASIYAVLPAQDAIALDLTLDHAARHAKNAGDARTLDQLRADTLATVGVNALTTGQITLAPTGDPLAHEATPSVGTGSGDDARKHGNAGSSGSAGGAAPAVSLGAAPVRVHVTVPFTTLLGGGEPGTLDGYGPIDPATARALTLRGTWKRLVTDPLTGTVLDHGRTTYRPPKDLADLVRDRDGTCVRPGCGTAATRCELDHSLAWSLGGTTALTNLGSACGGDHDLKTCGHFKVRQIGNGVFEWTSSLTGLTYRRETDGTITYLNPRLPGSPPRRLTGPAAGLESPGADPPY